MKKINFKEILEEKQQLTDFHLIIYYGKNPDIDRCTSSGD